MEGEALIQLSSLLLFGLRCHAFFEKRIQHRALVTDTVADFDRLKVVAFVAIPYGQRLRLDATEIFCGGGTVEQFVLYILGGRRFFFVEGHYFSLFDISTLAFRGLSEIESAPGINDSTLSFQEKNIL